MGAHSQSIGKGDFVAGGIAYYEFLLERSRGLARGPDGLVVVDLGIAWARGIRDTVKS